MRYTITAPVATFSGDFAGVYFRNGVATVDDADPAVRAALAYCRRRGYAVAEAEQDEPVSQADGTARPKDYAAKAEWVAYAIARGADPAEAEAATKADLVTQYGTLDDTSDEEGTST